MAAAAVHDTPGHPLFPHDLKFCKKKWTLPSPPPPTVAGISARQRLGMANNPPSSQGSCPAWRVRGAPTERYPCAQNGTHATLQLSCTPVLNCTAQEPQAGNTQNVLHIISLPETFSEPSWAKPTGKQVPPSAPQPGCATPGRDCSGVHRQATAQSKARP